MKRILIICFLLISSVAFADTHTATKNGCWADTSVWDVSAVPENGDSVELAGYIVTAIGNGTTDCTATPSAAIPATGTLLSISSTGTAGQIEYKLGDDDCHGGCALSATTITAGTKPATGGIILLSDTTDHVMNITTGTGTGEGIIAGSNVSAFGVNNTGTGTVNVVGKISGSNASWGFNNESTGAINVTGNIVGGGGQYGHGFYNNSTGAVTITGNITGGSAASTNGFLNNAAAAVTVTGNISGGTGNISYGFYNNTTGSVSVSGTITGGGYSFTSAGFYNNSGNVTLSATSKLVQGAAAAAIVYGKSPAWASGGSAQFYVGASFGQAANTTFSSSSGGAYAY